jgi:5-methylthioribose kinase
MGDGNRFRLGSEDRRLVIITAAQRLARDLGESWELTLTHGDVAKRCSVATSTKTVLHYCPRKSDLVAAVKGQ